MDTKNNVGSYLINDSATSTSLEPYIFLKANSYFKLLTEKFINKNSNRECILPVLNEIQGEPVADRHDFLKIRLSHENLVKFQDIMKSADVSELFNFILTQGEGDKAGSLNILSSYLPTGNIFLDRQFLVHQLGNSFLAFTYLNGAVDYDLFIESFVQAFHEFRSENSSPEFLLESRVVDEEDISLGRDAAEKERHLHQEIKNRALKSMLKKFITSPSMLLSGIGLGISGLSLLYLGQMLPIIPFGRLYSLGINNQLERPPRLRDIYDISIQKIFRILNQS